MNLWKENLTVKKIKPGGSDLLEKMNFLRIVTFQLIQKRYHIYISQVMRNSGVGNEKTISTIPLNESEVEGKLNDILDKEEIFRLKLSLEKLRQFVRGLGKLKDTILVDCVTAFHTSAEIECLNIDKVLKACELRVDKMIKNRKLKKNWSSPDILILIWVLAKYIELNSITTTEDLTTGDWDKIAQLIPGTTGEQCLFRWLNLHKNRLSFNQWSSEQSTLLRKIVKEIGTENWKEISQILYKQYQDKNKVFRTAKQCRQHWSCYLNPVLKKGPWQQEEDIKLIKEILAHKGAKKWSVIAKKFNGRTENALKNRYNLLIQKQIKLEKKNKNQTVSQLQMLRKYLEERCVSSIVENSQEQQRQKTMEQKIIKIQDTSSKTMVVDFEHSKCQRQEIPFLLSLTSPFKTWIKEDEQSEMNGIDERRCDAPFGQEKVSLINYFFQQRHHQ